MCGIFFLHVAMSQCKTIMNLCQNPQGKFTANLQHNRHATGLKICHFVLYGRCILVNIFLNIAFYEMFVILLTCYHVHMWVFYLLFDYCFHIGMINKVSFILYKIFGLHSVFFRIYLKLL